MTDPTATAEQLKAFAKLDGKPILASWMGGSEVEPGKAILNQAEEFQTPASRLAGFALFLRTKCDSPCDRVVEATFVPSRNLRRVPNLRPLANVAALVDSR